MTPTPEEDTNIVQRTTMHDLVRMFVPCTLS